MRVFFLCYYMFLFLFLGCATSNYRDLTQVESKLIDSNALPSLFKNANPAPLYKTDVNLYGKKFGGLLLIKNMPDSSYRIVFTTETGIKLFDFELKGEKFTVEYCIEKFNKDAVINTIAGDMKLLLLENREHQIATVLQDAKNMGTIYKFSSEGVDDYYFKDATSKFLTKVEEAAGKKKKVVIALSDYKNAVPAMIRIAHKNIRLKIDLQLLER